MSKTQLVGAVRVCRIHALDEDGDGRPILEVACQQSGTLVPLQECISCEAYLEVRNNAGALCVACDPAVLKRQSVAATR